MILRSISSHTDWRRKYEHVFTKYLNDALGSSEETRTWLELSRDCGYLAVDIYDRLERGYDEVSATLYSLMEKWETFEDPSDI